VANRPYRAKATALHRERTDQLLKPSARQWHYERYEAAKKHKLDIERRRAGQVVIPFTMDETAKLYLDSLPIPFDLLPSEYWREPGARFPRFGEEALGDQF
jgi:hypothetical protein